MVRYASTKNRSTIGKKRDRKPKITKGVLVRVPETLKRNFHLATMEQDTTMQQVLEAAILKYVQSHTRKKEGLE